MIDLIGGRKEDKFAISGHMQDCPLPADLPATSGNYWTGEPGQDWTLEEALIMKAKMFKVFSDGYNVENEYLNIYPDMKRPSRS